MTSSNCMMISEPIEFCSEMECSGVSSLSFQVSPGLLQQCSARSRSTQTTYIWEPSCGLRNRTPSSVTLANLRSETIWKL